MQPNTLRAGRSGGGGREGSQTLSEHGGVVEWARRAAKHTENQEEWWRGPGGQPNALRAGRSGGVSSRAAKRTQSPQELWRGPGGQPNALRAGRSGGGGQEVSQTHSELGGVVEGARRAVKCTQSR